MKNAFSDNKLLKNGLMSMPNLKVSMEINDNIYEDTFDGTDNDNNTLKLDKIIQKSTK